MGHLQREEVCPRSDTCGGGVSLRVLGGLKVKIYTDRETVPFSLHMSSLERRHPKPEQWNDTFTEQFRLRPLHQRTPSAMEAGQQRIGIAVQAHFWKLGRTSHGNVTKAWRHWGHPRTSWLTVIQTQKQTNQQRFCPIQERFPMVFS